MQTHGRSRGRALHEVEAEFGGTGLPEGRHRAQDAARGPRLLEHL